MAQRLPRLPAGLAAALRATRERLGLNLAAAGRLVGITPSYLSQLEKGRCRPSVAVARDLVDALELAPGIAAWLISVAAPDGGRSHPGKRTRGSRRSVIGQQLAEALALRAVVAARSSCATSRSLGSGSEESQP